MRTPTQIQSTRPSKARDPYTVQLDRLAGGAFAALSSNGQDWYRVERVGDTWQCSCKGFAARQTCCHSLAAALPRCEWCLSTTDVQTYENGFEGLGAEISLCDACITSLIPDCCAEHPAGCGARHA